MGGSHACLMKRLYRMCAFDRKYQEFTIGTRDGANKTAIDQEHEAFSMRLCDRVGNNQNVGIAEGEMLNNQRAAPRIEFRTSRTLIETSYH